MPSLPSRPASSWRGGVTKVSEATIALLERRLRRAEQWRSQSPSPRATG